MMVAEDEFGRPRDQGTTNFLAASSLGLLGASVEGREDQPLCCILGTRRVVSFDEFYEWALRLGMPRAS